MNQLLLEERHTERPGEDRRERWVRIGDRLDLLARLGDARGDFGGKEQGIEAAASLRWRACIEQGRGL
jgi:hypothetical protein